MDASLVILTAVFIGLCVMVIWLAFWMSRRTKQMHNDGYEEVHRPFYVKDDMFYFINSNFKPKPIEITGVSAIRQNSRLMQLEIRFRMNGAIQSVRVSGSADMLLNLADRFGYSI